MFPKVDMKIREPAHDFLKQMKDLIDEAGGFETRITLEPPNDTHSSCLGFSPEKTQVHEGLVGLFVNWSDEYPLIRLQAIASRWQPDPPTYPVVCQAAAELYKPFIDAYNRKYKTRYRMRFDTQEETLPQLRPAARKAFDEFAGWAYKRCLHPLDWQRFYRFVRICHATRNDLYESDLVFFLKAAGFDAAYATEIAHVFLHLREFHIQSDWRREASYKRRQIPKGRRKRLAEEERKMEGGPG